MFKKLSKNAKIGLAVAAGLIGVLLIAGTIFWTLTNKMTEVAETHLESIASEDLEKAYSLTSQEFQENTSATEFTYFVDTYSVLKNYKKSDFKDKKLEYNSGNIVGTLTGEIETKNGTEIDIRFDLVKEDGDWKIQYLELGSQQ